MFPENGNRADALLRHEQKLVGKETYNLTFVGYYPSEHPRVAFSVVVPSVQDDHDHVSKNIAKGAVDAYKELEKKYNKK